MWTGVRVIPAKGRVEARGKFTRKRAVGEEVVGKEGKKAKVDAEGSTDNGGDSESTKVGNGYEELKENGERLMKEGIDANTDAGAQKGEDDDAMVL